MKNNIDIFTKVYLESIINEDIQNTETPETPKKKEIYEIKSEFHHGKTFTLGKDDNGNYYFTEAGPDAWESLGQLRSSLEAENLFHDLVIQRDRPYAKDDDDDDYDDDEEPEEDFETYCARNGYFPHRRW